MDLSWDPQEDWGEKKIKRQKSITVVKGQEKLGPMKNILMPAWIHELAGNKNKRWHTKEI